MAGIEFSEIEFFKKRVSSTERLLAVKQQQIDSLLEITRAVNNNLPISALSRIYENILRAQLGVSKVALFIKGGAGNWECITPSDLPAEIVNYPVQEKFSAYHFILPVAALKDGSLEGFEYFIPVEHKKEPIGYALIGPSANEQRDTKEEKLKFIQTITNIIVVANENKKLLQVQLEQLMMQKELSLAADMQNMLIPTDLPDNEIIEASAYYKPHKNVGGDYYDLIQVSDTEIAFCVCDISGKGVPAALLMANFQANMRLLTDGKLPLTEVVNILNKKVGQITKGEKYLTLFIATYDYKKRLLTYINAGHTPSLLFDKNEIHLLDKGCTIIGMFEDIPNIEYGEIVVSPGAVMVNYTDGLSEAANNKGELFETEGLTQFLTGNHQLSIKDFNTKLIETVIEYKQGNEFDDDITLLTLRFK